MSKTKKNLENENSQVTRLCVDRRVFSFLAQHEFGLCIKHRESIRLIKIQIWIEIVWIWRKKDANEKKGITAVQTFRGHW